MSSAYSAYVFYSNKKSFKTSSNVVGQSKAVVPLNDFHVFFGFADGHWVLYDSLNDKKLKEGKIDGDPSKHLTLFKSPRALDEKTIMYTNSSLFKLQALNPYTGEHISAWEHDVPTEESLLKTYRSNEKIVDNAYVSFDLQVLKKSRMVGVLERKEGTQSNSEFLISVFGENSLSRILQVNHQSQGTQMKLSNGNDENLFVYYPTVQSSDSFEFYLLNVNEKQKGLIQMKIPKKLESTICGAFPWGKNQITFFGNPDEGGIPNQFVYNLESNDLEVIPMKCNTYNNPTILRSVMFVDPGNSRVLLKEMSRRGSAIGVWSSALNKMQFAREQEAAKDAVGSYNGTYFVEYDGNQKGETSTMQFIVSRLVTKKLFLLHFMRHAVYNNKPLINIHGRVDVLRDVANMF